MSVRISHTSGADDTPSACFGSREESRVTMPFHPSALGLELDDVPVLEWMLRDGLAVHEAYRLFALEDGAERWVVEWVVLGRLGPMRLISAWNVAGRPGKPRLVSCYLKRVR